VAVAIAFSAACTENRTPAPPAASTDLLPLYEGAHDGADCAGITGWVMDQNHPNSRVQLDIYEGGTRIGSVNADQPRPDLSSAGLGDGKYGFRYRLPAALRDAKGHSISVKIAATQTDLKNTPRTLTCNPDEHAFQGGHDAADCTRTTGWAWDEFHPDAPQKVDIFDGDVPLDTVTANQFRQDLRDASIGSGMYGFVYDIPGSLVDGKTHSLQARVAGTIIGLNGTPKTITCPAK